MDKPFHDFAINRTSSAWMVIGLSPGKVACLNGLPQDRLSLNEADDMAALLNGIEGNPRPALG